MVRYRVVFNGSEGVEVPAGTLLSDAAIQAGIFLAQPCGGQGRCGRCAVQVTEGSVRKRSTLRLSPEDVSAGYALACQAVVEGDAAIVVPEQDSLQRHLMSDRQAADVRVPEGYDWKRDQTVRRLSLTLAPPSMDDQRDDWSRLQKEIERAADISGVRISLDLLRRIGPVLRQGAWQVTAVVAQDKATGRDTVRSGRLLSITPGHTPLEAPLWGIAVDIGTTTVSVWLVDLISGQVLAQAAEYNRQIHRGEDVISRVIFAAKKNGQSELRDLVLTSINTLVTRVCEKGRRQLEAVKEQYGNGSAPGAINPDEIVKATVAGNSIMMHLLLGIPSESIRQSPFVTAVNTVPVYKGTEVGLDIHPEAAVICLPGIASYVGADISAGVLSSGLDDKEDTCLFMDIGTNGELVLGGKDWLVTCACSAGPAFEGAGVKDGMRATRGAIEEVWIDGNTYEPSLRVIGSVKPRGLCGSGLISLLAELFLTGVIDKGGHFNATLDSDRIRRRDNGWEYVVAWADESWHEEDITITRADIDNLIRAKAAIYGGITVLAESVGVPLADIEEVLIGGAFGKYINVEKAIQIGLLPDMPWESFRFLGNTAVLGAYYALLSETAERRIGEIAGRMTYIELSADNSFYEAFTSALFLPHTDERFFPTVAEAMADASEVY